MMQNYVQTIPGTRQTVTNASIGPVTDAPRGVRSLTAVHTVGGDRKTPNPQYFNARLETYLNGFESYVNPNGTYTTYLGVGNQGGTPPTFSFSVSAYNEALSRVFDKIRGDIDLSIDILQYRQTVSMVNKAVSLVLHSRSALKRMQLSSPKGWGSLWLEYQYGVKPTLSTIFGILEQIQKPQANWFKAVGRSTKVEKGLISRPGVYSFVRNEQEWIQQRRCEIGILFKLSDSALQSMANYTSLNPASIIWENIPYSFVADWVYDLGGYIRNMESALLYQLDFRVGWVTQSCLTTAKQLVQGSGKIPGFTTTYVVNQSASYRQAVKSRSPLGGVPFPQPPELKLKLGSERLISAAALLSQQLDGPRRRSAVG